MAMIPMRTVLDNRESVNVSALCFYRHLCQERDAIFRIGKIDSMPVHGSRLIHFIMYMDFRRVAFGKSECWHGNHPIDRNSPLFLATVVDQSILHIQIVPNNLLRHGGKAEK